MSVHTCPKSRPLRSRLMEFHLPGFDFDEFREIIMMVANRCRLTREVADKITSVEWYEMGCLRKALRLAKLVTIVYDVENVASTIMKYNSKIPNQSLTTHSG